MMNQTGTAPVARASPITKPGRFKGWQLSPMTMPPHTQTFLRESFNDDSRTVRFAEIAKMAKAIVRVFKDVA